MISARGYGVASTPWKAVQIAAWAAVGRDEIAGADSLQTASAQSRPGALAAMRGSVVDGPEHLDAGCLVSRHYVLPRAERHTVPAPGVELQDAFGLGREPWITGEIQLRCRHGRRASWLSHRHNVVPLIWATSPCATTACCRSVSAQRVNGTPRCAGSSHARVLTATTTLGGKADRPPASSSSSRPGNLCRQKRCLHLLTIWRGRSRRAAMTSLDTPWAASNTSFARTTSLYGDVYLRARASSSCRASGSARSDTGSPWA
jgi:hypothetical protein